MEQIFKKEDHPLAKYLGGPAGIKHLQDAKWLANSIKLLSGILMLGVALFGSSEAVLLVIAAYVLTGIGAAELACGIDLMGPAQYRVPA